MTGFEVVDSRTVARVGFLAVDEAHVRADDGEEFTRVVVRHPGAVVVVPVEDDGRHARLVRQFRAPVGGSILEVVAGKRDVDGEAPAATAVRELEEEIGCRPRRLLPVAEFYNTPGFCDEYAHLFVAVGLEELGVPRAVGPEERAMRVERIALADVERLVATRELVDAKSIIGLLLARAAIGDG